MTTIIRTEYNPEGTESVLGLPAVTVSQDFDGSINQGALSIEDAAEIEHISINDNNSANILSLVAKVADVKLQDRQVFTDITKPIVTGVPIDAEGNADYSVEPTEVELTEVVLSEPVTVDGIPVAKAWRAATDKSFTQIKGSVALMDGVPSYNTADNSNRCIYRVLSKEQATDIARVMGIDVSDGIQVDVEDGMPDQIYEVTSAGSYIIAIIARNAMTTFCSVVSVSVGINGGVPAWITSILKHFPTANIPALNTAYKQGARYTTDGLCFMMDCSSASADTWSDIIGNKEFVGTNVVIDNGVPYFDGKAFYKRAEVFFSNNTHTIEVVFKKKSSTYTIYIGQSEGNIALAGVSVGIISWVSDTNKIKPLQNNTAVDTLQVISCYQDGSGTATQYHNCNLTPQIGSPNSLNTGVENLSIIGCRTTSYTNSLIGYIYAIRIYNKLLTEEEIVHNQRIDIARFGDK